MSDNSLLLEDAVTEVVFEADIEVSSEEIPMEEWSSYILEAPVTNKKKLLFNEGQYHPGSGIICGKYIGVSDSDIVRHPYYNYPAVTDPGIFNALYNPQEQVIYPEDGQELYLAICKAMNQCPVRQFLKGLLDEIIDLRYYCVNPAGVRPMAMALNLNRYVKILNLTDNFLSIDSCYHLGEMLSINSCIEELNLSGCRIGSAGAKRLFAGLVTNKTLTILNLDRNQLSDQGMEYLAQVVFEGIYIQKISLSYNGIGGKGAGALAEALETYNKFTHIDLSWNNLFTPIGTFNLLSRFGESKVLQDLNLSWNAMSGIRLGTALKNTLAASDLRVLNLSNNKLNGEAIKKIIDNLPKAKKLITLDLSFNPMTPDDAKAVLIKVKNPNVKVHQILMENVFVTRSFLVLLRIIKQIKSKQNLIITYGGVLGFKPKGCDPRELLLDRAEFLAKQSKKRPVDIALVAMQLVKDNNYIMPTTDFAYAIQQAGAVLDNDLVEEMGNVWAGPRTDKSKTIDVNTLVEYMKRKWPERKLPDTPPPEPQTELLVSAASGPVSQTKAKGKKK